MRFGAYLASALSRAGYTQRSFALRVKHHQANFNQIIQGKRPPPLKHIHTWAALLKDHIDPKLFTELAELAHCPENIQKLVDDLQEKIKNH